MSVVLLCIDLYVQTVLLHFHAGDSESLPGSDVGALGVIGGGGGWRGSALLGVVEAVVVLVGVGGGGGGVR